MNLNPQQESIIQQFRSFLTTLSPNSETPFGYLPPTFFIGGYAGTGKTTILQQIAEAGDGYLALFPDVGGVVHIAAPTNKAAKRLRQKIARNATTLHYLLGARPKIYLTSKIPELEQDLEDSKIALENNNKDSTREKIAKLGVILGTLTTIKGLEEQLESGTGDINAISERIQSLQEKLTEFPMGGSSLQPGDILVCDESSMVGQDLRDKIYAKNPLAVVWVGDPGQLDPVKSPRWFEPNPQTTLSQVMRQGKESGILKLATLIREKGTANTHWLATQLAGYSDVEFIFERKGDIVDWEYLADQYGDRWLTWRNGFKTRNHKYHTRKLNEIFRYTLGFESPYPQAGDRLYITGRYINRCLSAKERGVWLSKGDEVNVLAAGTYNESIVDLLSLNAARATSDGFEASFLSKAEETKMKLLGEKKPDCICDILDKQNGSRPLFCNGTRGFYRNTGVHPWKEIAEESQGIHALMKNERGVDFWSLIDPSDLLWNDDQRNALWRLDQYYLNECDGDPIASRSPIKSTLKASYAYCISVHQSQGSEWDNVVVYYDPWMAKSDPKNAIRWLYTAVTRAAQRLCIVTI